MERVNKTDESFEFFFGAGCGHKTVIYVAAKTFWLRTVELTEYLFFYIIWQPVFTTNSQIRTVTYCTHLATYLTSKTQFRTHNFSDSVDSAAMIQTSTPNGIKMSNFFSEHGYPDNILSTAV